jgi:hypothetical protein
LFNRGAGWQTSMINLKEISRVRTTKTSFRGVFFRAGKTVRMAFTRISDKALKCRIIKSIFRRGAFLSTVSINKIVSCFTKKTVLCSRSMTF